MLPSLTPLYSLLNLRGGEGVLQEGDATHTKAEEPSLPLNIEDLEHWYLGFRIFFPYNALK